jgi:threonine dehydratase
MMLSLRDIKKAYHSIKMHVFNTTLEYSKSLSMRTGANVYFKHEDHQKTGSFKIRGALNRLKHMTEDEKRCGVICASTGNHGMGVALAGLLTDIAVTVCLPKDTSKVKVTAIEHYDAEIIFVDGDCLAAEKKARTIAAEQNKIFVSPYNDPYVIAGQGTIGFELHEQLPVINSVFVAVGGGGLIGGIGSYFKNAAPHVKVVGCWPENSPVLYQCLKAGEIIDVAEQSTISDSTAGGIEEGSLTFDIAKEVIDEAILVSEEEIRQAMRIIAEEERYIIEGSSGVSIASFLKNADQYKGKNVAIILCGRNIDYRKFEEAVRLVA